MRPTRRRHIPIRIPRSSFGLPSFPARRRIALVHELVAVAARASCMSGCSGAASGIAQATRSSCPRARASSAGPPPMTKIYSKQRARRAVFHTLARRPPGQIATVIGYVLLVRLLSEAEYGIYNLFYALLPLL